MQSSNISKKLSSASNVMFDTITDTILYVAFNAMMGIGVRSMREADYAMYQADILLNKYNGKTIRKNISNLISRRYLQKKQTDTGIQITITTNGIARMKERIPTYKEKRPWDGYLYLISYDIPVKSNTKRNLLRYYLHKIGCALLQDSLWMTPYNPTKIVNSFIDTYGIPGTILISKLGKDGSIGDEDRKSLIYRVYSYEKHIEKYEAFIQTYQHTTHPSPNQCSFEYHMILKEDPQLPFSLEPDDFPAKTAYQLFRSIIT